ncbi:hypothetical protein PJF56_10640 [Roseofilum sp. BLCC_M91]|uniref:Uncharacterized protein n=1 Tax=Roseofilum halophilum BLCC-M91 TaxID=3022259 RepID=A0ABT7BJG5_9CYAN|nr:hypothetical protein [Roseofilum halophilum]MDJ1179322.1 hypothetical protein [Roseofilum halophilum BLCC-M91]
MKNDNTFRQQATPTICPKCAGRGRRIRQFEGYFCKLAWVECLDCDFYIKEFDKSEHHSVSIRRQGGLW